MTVQKYKDFINFRNKFRKSWTVEDLKKLYESALFGNMHRIQEQAAQLAERDAKYGPFADKLCELAKNFEDEQLVALIKPFMEKQE